MRQKPGGRQSRLQRRFATGLCAAMDKATIFQCHSTNMTIPIMEIGVVTVAFFGKGTCAVESAQGNFVAMVSAEIDVATPA